MELAELQRQWDLFGRADPFWSILTDPRRRNGRWDQEEFFRSGQKDVEAAFATLQDLGAVPRRRRALDFGCGVGRLTQALCDRFDSVVGVDISTSMVELAKRYNRFHGRCEYAVNARDDLSLFPDGSFDFVFTLIVLQHMPSTYSRRYLAEFLRVTTPGGLIVFQVPSALKIVRSRGLSRGSCRAHIECFAPLSAMRAGCPGRLTFRVKNDSREPWPLLPSGEPMPLKLGNHWLDARGRMYTQDDGRTPLPRAIAPGETVEVELEVTAPAIPGSYLLEIDLVQEGVTWFARRGSPTWRHSVEVRSDEAQGTVAIASAAESAEPRMEMCFLPRLEIERLVSRYGGEILATIERDSCGAEYENYQYFVRKRHRSRLLQRLARPLRRCARAILGRDEQGHATNDPDSNGKNGNGAQRAGG